MRSTFGHPYGRIMSLIVSALIGLAVTAVPVAGEVVIEGVSEGQVVTGELLLSAVSDAKQNLGVTIHLTGPDGTELLNRSNGLRTHLLTADGEPSQGAAWNALEYPEGSYSVAAYATEWQRTGRRVLTVSTNFTVEHPHEADPSSVSIGGGVGETLGSATQEPSDEAVGAQPVNGGASPASAPAASANEGAAQPLRLSFAAGVLTERHLGDDQGIKVVLEGEMPSNADVLILVWDQDRRKMVEDFVLSMRGTALRVSGQRLDTLPLGNMEIQAHYRIAGEIQTTVKHRFDNLAEELLATGELPNVKFSDPADQTFVRGAARDIGIDLAGSMPSDGDVLILAWSLDESRLINVFSHVLTEGPWEVTTDKLDLLPMGRLELQLRPRRNGKIEGKIVKTITITGPTTVALPNAPDAPAVADGGTPDNPADNGDAPADKPKDVVAIGGGEEVVVAPQEAVDAVEVKFAAGTPSSYVQGSGVPFRVAVDGSLPNGTDVLMLAWHLDQSRNIPEFAHELKAAPFEVANDRLDQLPAGRVELQAMLRVPGKPIVLSRRVINIVAGERSDDNAAQDNQVAADVPVIDFSGMNLSEEGFTVFTKSADTRVIYVSSTGKDTNDGLSTATPVKTPSVGYGLLRNGKPDWLLFKAGDTFNQNLGTLNKSGRSEAERMLIGVYGDGSRPIFNSPSNSWLLKNFNHTANHVAIVGLHIVASNRDSSRPGFNANNMTREQWNQNGMVFFGYAKDLLVEDCVVEYFKFGLVFQSDKAHGLMEDVKVRRTAIRYSYGHHDAKIAGHSSGLYLEYLLGGLIEECVLDRNGWNPDVPGAVKTKFNHNAYVQKVGKPVTFRGNIITNAAAHGLQLRIGGEISDSLFVANPMAFFVGKYDSLVARNVVLKSNDLGPDSGDHRGMGIGILPTLNARVENNIISQKAGSMQSAAAIEVVWERENDAWLAGRPFKVALKDNKVYHWPQSADGKESAIQIRTDTAQIIENTRNALDAVSGGSGNPPWIDPERDVESYMKTLGRPASLDAFLDAASYRPRGQWVKEFSASAVNLYIRRGFDTAPFD